MKYRADVDGLRAVAVVSVVVYHIGNSVGINGYLGVDIFFVISGFLITSIIYTKLSEGQFSLKEFYIRRACRILPALFTVILVTSILASQVLLPNEALPFARSVFAATFFFSNILFYSESGYFDSTAELKPLLHTWSLSVEEQFYIVFPLLMLVAFARGNKFLRNSILALLAVSLLWNMSFPRVFSDSNFAFFMFPVRAWELLAGSLLALSPKAQNLLNSRMATTLSILGGLLVLLGFIVKYPGDFSYVFYTFPVVLGTCLIIFSGSGSTLPVVNRFLGNKIFLFFGRISFSLYLWHWPIYVLLLYHNFGRLSDLERSLVGLLSVVLAYLSWRFVEQPFRKAPMENLWPKARTAIVSSAIILSASGFTVVSDGLYPWTDHKFQRFVNVELGGDYEFAKFDGLKAQVLGVPADHEKSTVALVGDSHALAIAPAIDDLSTQADRTALFFTNGCVAIEKKLLELEKVRNCVNLSIKQADYLADQPGIETVILANRWYSKTVRWVEAWGLEQKEAWALRESSLRNFVKKLTASGKKVVILAQVPLVDTRFKKSLPSVVARMIKQDHSDLESLFPLRESYLNRNRDVLDLLERIADGTGAVVLYPHETLCQSSMCQVYDDEGMIYWDDDHLSVYGAQKISPLFEPFIQRTEPEVAGKGKPDQGTIQSIEQTAF
ncbi:MAG: acyltransferase [Roseibium sp.]|uniref:acyltransferase family protein n=1 Tax=Roseibium sp. TaxID=1936156 RepID=UPI00261AC39F|nr:acyltransferase family protein [Roseibium sp.]MCV0428775.1 acyltransferase [Roseibium sp.]